MPAEPHFADDAAIIRIGTGLFDRTLPQAEWTHAAHFAAAVWVIAARPDLAVPGGIAAAIRAYNEATGVPNTDTDGYHETITLVSLRAAEEAVWRADGHGLADTCNFLLASPLGRSKWLLAYWSQPVLFSAQARRHWVDPDRAPLPPTFFAVSA